MAKSMDENSGLIGREARASFTGEVSPFMREFVVAALAAFTLITLVGGCSSGPSPTPSGARDATEWGPLAVVPTPVFVSDALTRGTLRISDTCVTLEDADESWLLIWPVERTTWDHESRAIRLTGERNPTLVLTDGQRLIVGGGGTDGRLPEGDWVPTREWIAPPAASCPIDNPWWVAEVSSI